MPTVTTKLHTEKTQFTLKQKLKKRQNATGRNITICNIELSRHVIPGGFCRGGC